MVCEEMERVFERICRRSRHAHAPSVNCRPQTTHTKVIRYFPESVGVEIPYHISWWSATIITVPPKYLRTWYHLHFFGKRPPVKDKREMRRISDVDSLISVHMQKYDGDLSLRAFSRTWTASSFSFIQNARLLESLEGEHEQILYSAALSLITGTTACTSRRFLAIYAIYMLYSTQFSSPRVRVHTSPKEFKQLCELAQAAKKRLIIDVVHVLRLLVNKHAFSIGVYFEKTLDHSVPYRVCKQAGMAFDPPKLATAAQTFDDDTQAKCLLFEVGEQNNFVCNGSSRLSAVSDDALRYLRQNRIPSTFHDVATTSRAYSSAASFVLNGPQRLIKLNSNTDSRRVDVHNRITRQVIRGDALLRAALRSQNMTQNSQASTVSRLCNHGKNS
jgi:hypothetical protein